MLWAGGLRGDTARGVHPVKGTGVRMNERTSGTSHQKRSSGVSPVEDWSSVTNPSPTEVSDIDDKEIIFTKDSETKACPFFALVSYTIRDRIFLLAYCRRTGQCISSCDIFTFSALPGYSTTLEIPDRCAPHRDPRGISTARARCGLLPRNDETKTRTAVLVLEGVALEWSVTFLEEDMQGSDPVPQK